MVSTEKMKAEIQKIGLEREVFCRKMWAEIEQKRKEFRKDIQRKTKNYLQKVLKTG